MKWVLYAASLLVVASTSSAPGQSPPRWSYGRPNGYGYYSPPQGNERYNVRPNFGGPQPGTIVNPYRLTLPNGQQRRIYTNLPGEQGTPLNPYRIR